MPDKTQNFGEQAARFSLYAPFAVLLIGLVTAGNRDQSGVAITVVTINMLLIVAGLILGGVALLSMRRYGRKRILVRSAVGLLLNGLILVAVATLLVPSITAGRTKVKLAGHWQCLSAPRGSTRMELILDNNGAFTLTSFNGSTPVTSFEGQWVMTRDRVIGVTVEHVVQGKQSVVGQKIGLGIVQSVDDGQLILKTDGGQEAYTRE